MHTLSCPSCKTPCMEGDFFECECGEAWCGRCWNYDNHAEAFYYKSQLRCTFCFPTKVLKIRDSDLLEYALKKLGTNKKRLYKEVLKKGPAKFRKVVNTYKCTECTVECRSSHCDLVKRGRVDEEGERVAKGVCCIAWDVVPRCPSCDEWETKRTCIAILALKKYKRVPVLTQIPRDALIHALLIPYVWNRRIKK